jgi:hypothetical protein
MIFEFIKSLLRFMNPISDHEEVNYNVFTLLRDQVCQSLTIDRRPSSCTPPGFPDQYSVTI